MKKRKFNFSGVVAIVLAILVLVVLVPINVIFNYYDKYYDMTPSSMYTLSDTTVNLVNENSDKDVIIYTTFHVKELRDYSSYLPLYHTLTQLEEYDNVEIIEVIPDEDPTIINELDPNDNLSITTGDIIVSCDDLIKKVDASAIFPYDDNDISTYAGEELLAGAIQIVTSGSLPKIYFLTGHGEKSIDDEYSEYAEYLKTTNNYEAVELNLSEVDAVPEDTAIIFIAGPQTDLTDDETEKLREYAADGGAMAFFLAPVEDEIIFDNIEDLLEDYEIEMYYNVLEETNPNNLICELTSLDIYNGEDQSDSANSQNPRVFQIEYTAADSDSFTEDLTSGVLEMVSEGDVGGISNTRSFGSTGDDSMYIEKSPIIQTLLNTDSTGLSSGYSAVSVACGGDERTAEYAESLSGQILYPAYYSYNKQTGSKILAFGTTDILDASSMPQSTWLTQMLSLSSLIWLFDSNYDMNIGNKGISLDYMSFASAEEATSTLRIFTIVPICVAAVGLLVWLKRRHS
ncbi:MAG: GldG family protein [Ruminococcus sp.]|nr:GldG family protein [Ruminococcus sp.]